jgi:hypothetical protein
VVNSPPNGSGPWSIVAVERPEAAADPEATPTVASIESSSPTAAKHAPRTPKHIPDPS